MLVVGLTGGIGSGKTKVLHEFIKKEVPVYIADIEAKKLMQNSSELKEKIISTFGESSYQDKKLNTAYLAEIVFKNPIALAKLNALVHPAVFEHFQDFKNSLENEKLVIFENAILYESGSDRFCDYVICVTAAQNERVKRVMLRDQVTAAQVQERMNNQWPEEKKVALADFVIENMDWSKTKKNIDDVYEKLLDLSSM
jgi:dephospho-CoA kinase